MKPEHQRALKRLADAIAGRTGGASAAAPPPASPYSHPKGYPGSNSGATLVSLVGGLATLFSAQMLIWWLFPSSVPGAGSVWWQTSLGGLLSIRIGYMVARRIFRRNSTSSSRA